MGLLIQCEFRFDANCFEIGDLFECFVISFEGKFTGKLLMWKPISYCAHYQLSPDNATRNSSLTVGTSLVGRYLLM